MSDPKAKTDKLRCCCCFSTKDLSNMLMPIYIDGSPQIIAAMIAVCFQIEIKSTVNEYNKDIYMMCKTCICRLRDASEFRKAVQSAYDRAEDIKPHFISKRNAPESEDDSNINDMDTNSQMDMTSNEDEILEAVNCNNMGLKTKNTSLIKKLKRNSGQEYCSKSGKVVPAKKFENIDCMCSRKCITLIDESERESLFRQFWSMADFDKQNVFLYSNTRRFTVKRRRPKDCTGTPRTYGYKYYLNTSHDDVLVCKKFFIDTFSVSQGRLTRLLRSTDIGKDKRGRMEGSRRKTAESVLDVVRDHIRSFPTFECHYEQPGRIYLSPGLNVKKMFSLYLQKCQENNLPTVNEWTYRNVFKNEFDLHFQDPHDGTKPKKVGQKSKKNSF